ncbi:MAG: hypothetical protein ACLQM8_28010 [Limisphaerales bacterium]
MYSQGVIRLSALEARRFHRRTLLLDTPVPSVSDALARLGFVQVDPINVCGRMSDLILRNRVAGYREGELVWLLDGAAGPALAAAERTAFAHALPCSNVLAALPLDRLEGLNGGGAKS